MTKHIAPRKTRGILAVRADASGDAEIKKIAADLTKAFEDFKKANDERLNAKADVVVDEKVDRINADVTKLQTTLDEKIAETQSRMDELEKLEARLNAGGGDKADRDFKAEARIFHAGRKGVEDFEVDDARADSYQKYCETFAQYLKYGDKSHDIQALMQVGSDPDGGQWVPTEMSNRIIARIFETSPMRQVSNVLQITSDSIEFPNDTNDGTSGGWVGETDTRSETGTPQVGMSRIYVREQYAMPFATQKLLDMATIDIEAWLGRKTGDKMGRTENTAFVSGTGVDQPRGFLDYKSAATTTDDSSRAWGVLQYVVSGAAGGFPTVSGVPSASDPDALITMLSKLKPEYRGNARWMMNRATEAAIRKLKDGDGNYFIGTIADAATGFQLLGYPITTAEDMPALASDSFSIALGDFMEGYQIVDGRGLRVLRDPFTTKGQVKFYMTKWTGGDVLNFDAIKLMKFGTS